MKNFLIVFSGGGAGSIVRYLLSRWVMGHSSSGSFPLGTFIVNIVACLILGAVFELADEKHFMSLSTRLLLTVGFCGGFSTFSTFSMESLALIQKGQFVVATSYILASVFVCLVATFAGIWIIRQLV